MPVHRSVQFAEESLAFVEEVNQMVTRLLGLQGSTKLIPEEESDPKVEAAAVMLAANLLGITRGDWDALRSEVWPRAARGNIVQFTSHVEYARAEEARNDG